MTIQTEYLARHDGDAEQAAVEVALDLMRGDPATFKAGYTAENAVLAASDLFPDAGQRVRRGRSGMTRRERLERKLEKRQEWAESRETKATAAIEESHRRMDQIPFGQPILVGHHSERADRRNRGRAWDLVGTSVGHSKMADHHRQAADGIERALATSIFSDDDDAVEKLHEKVARLEAKRDQMKAANAKYRAEHKAELKAMTPYERSQAIPYPSYSLTNLGATIRTAKQRAAQIARDNEDAEAGVRRGGRPMASRYGGTCPDCGGDFARGEQIIWYRTTREAVHATCPEEAVA